MDYSARKHWFFDFDGTLFDTEVDIKIAWIDVLKCLHLESPDFEKRYVTGPSLPEMTRILFPDHPDIERLIADVKANFARVYDEAGFPNTKPYPEAVTRVKALKASGKELYVATNKRRAPTVLLLEKYGLRDLFTEVYTSDSVPGRHLSKSEYLALALKTRGIDPADAVMVGDTAIDVRGGRANGMGVKTVDWGYGTGPFYARLARILGVSRAGGAVKFRETPNWGPSAVADTLSLLEDARGAAVPAGELDACETAEDLFLRTC